LLSFDLKFFFFGLGGGFPRMGFAYSWRLRVALLVSPKTNYQVTRLSFRNSLSNPHPFVVFLNMVTNLTCIIEATIHNIESHALTPNSVLFHEYTPNTSESQHRYGCQHTLHTMTGLIRLLAARVVIWNPQFIGSSTLNSLQLTNTRPIYCIWIGIACCRI
jgi:hypothetical protein